MASSKNLDFSNVKDGGNFNKKRLKAGDYLAKITKVEDAKAKDGVDQYLYTIRIESHPSAVYPYYCKLEEKLLWKLRNILIAGGKTVPKKKYKVDPNVIVGKLIGVTLEDSEYDGKEQSEVQAVFPASDLPDGDVPDSDVEDDDEDDEEEEEDTEEESEDEAEEESDDEEEVEDDEEEEDEGDEWDAIEDRLELRKALAKLNPEVKTSKAQSEDDIRDLIRAEVAKAAVKKKAPAKAAPAKKSTKKKASDVSDEELEELDIDDL